MFLEIIISERAYERPHDGKGNLRYKNWNVNKWVCFLRGCRFYANDRFSPGSLWV